MRPVIVKATVPEIEVIVGRAGPLGLTLTPPTADEGTKTITPVYGVPVGVPTASVGVMRPVVVKALLPATEVTVGREAPLAADEGT